jgi:hypothetical protein
MFEWWQLHGRNMQPNSASELQTMFNPRHHFKEKQWPNIVHLALIEDADINI